MLASLAVVLALSDAALTTVASYSGGHLQSVAPTLVGERLSGPDRYPPAAAGAAASFPGGATVAFIATGEDFPDALAAAAVAAGQGPVLLAGEGGLPSATAGELFRLHPSRVVVVGGELAIPAITLSEIAAVVPHATITRIAGDDRYSTAADLSEASFPQGSALVYVATGDDYPDALTAAAAAAGRAPVQLVGQGVVGQGGLPQVTADELTRLHPSTVVVVGGTLTVPSSTKAAIESLLPRADVFRASGADRYATAANVASYRFPDGAPIAYVATGEDFPDALAAAAAAGGRGPVLLVKPDLVPASTSAELDRLGARIVYFIGGPYAVSAATMDDLVQSFVPSPTTTTSTSTSTTTTTTTTSSTKTTSTTTGIETTPTTEFGTATTLGPGESLVGTSTTTTTIVLPPPPPPSPLAAVAVQTAYAQLGKPYAWAGAGPASFDCSGLTAYVWAAAGVVLPHNAAAQAALVAPVEPVASAWAPGDLLFYDTPIDHVAIYVGNGEMIEAEHSGVPVHLVAVRTQDLVGAGRPEPGR